jgi:hypothetical protein
MRRGGQLLWGPKDAGSAALLLLLAIVSQWRLLGLDRVLSSIDYARDIYPSFHWLHARYAAGMGVFWDQTSGLGDPLLDTSRSTIFYLPERLILTCFDAIPAVLACLIFHYYLAALGAYALARSQGASATASLAAAITVAFAGGMTYCSNTVGLYLPLSYFPWMILGLLLIQDCPSPFGAKALAGAAILGCSTGLALLSGHIGMGLCQLYALAVLYLCRSLLAPHPWAGLRTSFAAVGLAAILAALLYSGQAMALFRAAGQNSRGQAYSAQQASEGAMSPVTFPEMVLPHLLGQMKDNSFLGLSWRFGTYDDEGITLYCGILAFVMAAYFFLGSPWRQALPWALAWIFLALYALGDWTPAFRLFYLRLPLLDHLHDAVRAATQTPALLCVPIALGLDRLRVKRSPWPARAALGLGLAFLAGSLLLFLAGPRLEALGRNYVLTHVVGKALHPFPAAYYVDKLTRCLASMRTHLWQQGVWALASGLLLGLLVLKRWEALAPGLVLLLGLVLFGELYSNLWDYLPTLPSGFLDQKPETVAKMQDLEGPAAQPYRTLVWGIAAQIRRSFPQGRNYGDLAGELRNKELLPPDWNKLYGVDLCNTYPSADPLRLAAFFGWFKDADPALDPPQAVTELLARRRLYDLCGAKYFLLAQPLACPGLTLLESSQAYLYRNERALPLAYVAGQYSGGWNSASAVSALTDPASPESRWSKPALVEDTGLGTGHGQGQVRWRRYTDMEWALDVESRGPGILVLSRFFYPGPWKAEVDGRPTGILAANGALCALPLKGGEETVRVYYEDRLPALGLFLQALAFVLASMALVASFIRRNAA